MTLQIGEGPTTREPERRDAVFMTLITMTLITWGLFLQNQVNCDQHIGSELPKVLFKVLFWALLLVKALFFALLLVKALFFPHFFGHF